LPGNKKQEERCPIILRGNKKRKAKARGPGPRFREPGVKRKRD